MSDEHAGHDHSNTGTAPLPAGGRLLTPADVRNKVFRTVRVREGYDMAQVDGFLDQVEATLDLVLRENAELKRRPGPETSAPQIIALAQEAADRAVAMAKEQAGDIIADAHDRAEAARREALSHGGRVRAGLQDQIDRLRVLLAELEKRTVEVGT